MGFMKNLISHKNIHFYRASAWLTTQSPVLAIVSMSVRLSVRLSRADVVSKQRTLESQNLHRRIDQWLYFQDLWDSYRNSNGFSTSEGVKWVRYREGKLTFSANKSTYLRNGVPNLLLIANKKSYKRFRPCMTLNGRCALCFKTYVFRSPPQKNRMKIDPYYHRQKRSPVTVVSGNLI